jgi:hypothetical protein
MPVLRPVLLVRDLPGCWCHLRQTFPALREFVRPGPHPREQQALEYLRQGVNIAVFLDDTLVGDILSPGKRIDSEEVPALNVLSDGTWVWSGALIYYVEQYHVRLPEEFLAHAEAAGWQIRPIEDEEAIDLSAFKCVDSSHQYHQYHWATAS